MPSPSTLSTDPESPRRTLGRDGLEEKDEKETPRPEISVTERFPGPEDEFPDGGLRAWLIILGASACTTATFGFVNSWGTFQAYYQDVLLPNTSPSTIAWIGSLQYALVLLPALPIGRLFDSGYFKLPLFIASTLLVLGTIVTAECKKYWQLLLVQGFVIGVSCGVIFGPVIGAVATYFKKRRNFAFGIVAVGSSVGGTIFPLIARSLLPRVGFKWTMRILAFVLLFFMVLANLLLDRRLAPRKLRGTIVDLTHLKSAPFSVYTTGCFIGFLGLYTTLTYIGTAAQSYGVSSGDAYTLVSIANAGSLVGRLITGYLSDKYGPLNVMGPSTIVAAIMTYAWPFARTYNSIIPVAVLYGVFSGAFVGLLAAPIAALGNSNEVGERTGIMFTIAAFGALCGPPISGAVRKASDGWVEVGVCAGSFIMICVGLMATTKWLVHGSLIRGRI